MRFFHRIQVYYQKKPDWINRQLLMVLLVSLLFSMAMIKVDMAPGLEPKRIEKINSTNVQQENESAANSIIQSKDDKSIENRNRQTDGILFGSSMLVLIIMGGVMMNIRSDNHKRPGSMI